MSISLTSVGAVLVTHKNQITQEQIQAYSLSLLWSQAVMRKSGRLIGTKDYFEALSAEMGRISWNVTMVTVDTYSATDGSMNIACVTKGLTSKYLPPDQADSVNALFDLIDLSQPTDGLSSFLTTWWNCLDKSMSGTTFGVSPVILTSAGQITTTLSLLCFNASSSDWQSFFVGDVVSDIALRAYHVELTLNAKLFETLRQPIIEKLGQNAIASIRSLDL